MSRWPPLRPPGGSALLGPEGNSGGAGAGNGGPTGEEEFEALRRLYERERITGEGVVDHGAPTIRSMVADLDSTVESRLDALVDEPDDRDRIWEEHPLGEDHPEAEEPWRDLQASYGKLEPLARAYVMPSSAYEGDGAVIDAIEGAFEFLSEYYRAEQRAYGNWWQWEIGIPKAILSSLVPVGDELPESLVEHHLRAIEYHVGEPDIAQGSGDLLSKSDIWIRRGMVERDGDVMRGGRDPIADTLEYSDRNNIHRDGSAIDHGNIPYNLHYQGRFLVEIAAVAHLLRDSPWSLQAPDFPGDVERLYEWVYEAYEPLVWRGQAMSMVLGRHQRHDTEQSHGRRLVLPLVRLGELAPEPHGTRFKEIARGWIERNTYRSYVDEVSSVPTYATVTDLLDDDAVGSREPLTRYKQYYNMDRAVYRDDAYALGLAMLSDRIGNYEVLSDGRGPGRGWYTSYGMTYFYTDDLAQYNDGYWHTVDPEHLPGTTVNPAASPRITPDTEGASSHAGGVEFDGRVGTSSMELVSVVGEDGDGDGSDGDDHLPGGPELLTARKSWFCFGESVVAVGSDIAGESRDGPIRTTVANRNLGAEDTARVSIDGEAGPDAAPADSDRAAVDWAHLDRSPESIGYVFPDAPSLRVVREENDSGRAALGTRDTDRVTAGPFTRYFLKLALEHGTRPDGDGYVYAVLPGADTDATAAYAADPPLDVLERSAAVHAVEHADRALTGIQAFEATRVADTGIVVDGPASVMYRDGDDLTVAIADPTQRRDAVAVELPTAVDGTIEGDGELIVERTDPLRIVADTGALPDDRRGETLSASFSR